jgi:dolichol-phosphate mannosyltransferase
MNEQARVIGAPENVSPREVPAFEVLELQPKRTKYCVCTFVINEGERIRNQLRKMAEHADLVDIVIGDGGSTDGSLDEEYLRAQRVSARLTKRGPGKLSAQMRMALAYALDRGYEGVVVVDGNGKDDMSAIPSFVRALEEGYDHVQGSRYIPGGIAENTPLLRHIGVNILHAPLISLAAGFRYTDTTNGFRAYSARFLDDPRVQPFRDIFVGYELHYYLAIRAARLGFRVKETPVARRYPKHGATPTKISPFKGNLKVLQTLGRAVLGHYNP